MLFVISDDGESSASVQAFDAILAGPFQTYLTLAKKIGDDVAKHGVMVEAAFKAQRDFLVVAAKSQKPSDAGIDYRQHHLHNFFLLLLRFSEKTSVVFNTPSNQGLRYCS